MLSFFYGNPRNEFPGQCALAVCLAVMLCLPVLSADTVEVRHSLGVARVPVGPKRIVVFDLSILDSMDKLGVQGVQFAVPKHILPPYLAGYSGDEVMDAGGMMEPNLERIYEFAPDVIFISARQARYYDKLSEIAPTVNSNIDYNSPVKKSFIPVFPNCVFVV